MADDVNEIVSVYEVLRTTQFFLYAVESPKKSQKTTQIGERRIKQFICAYFLWLTELGDMPTIAQAYLRAMNDGVQTESAMAATFIALSTRISASVARGQFIKYCSGDQAVRPKSFH